jgi:hypothetical protein
MAFSSFAFAVGTVLARTGGRYDKPAASVKMAGWSSACVFCEVQAVPSAGFGVELFAQRNKRLKGLI